MTRNSIDSGRFSDERAAKEARGPRTARALVVVLTLLIAAATVWAVKTEIRALARAEGEIVPKGSMTFVDHLDGGVLAELLVEPGQRVREGQILARLSSPSLARRREEHEQERGILQERMTTLEALVAEGDTEILPISSYAATRRDLHRAQLALLTERARGRSAVLEIAENARSVAIERSALGGRELLRLRRLLELGHVPMTRIAAQEDFMQTIRSDLLATEASLSRALADEIDARAAIAEARLSYLQIVRQELYESAQDLARVDLRIEEISAQESDLDVRAPVAGIVQRLETTTPGEVVEPGDRMFEILPTSVELVANVRITPEDIGHIAMGDAVKVKPTAFDARRYGHLAGHISRISPTSTLDPKGFPYFAVEVSLDRSALDHGPNHAEIGAGMVVLAEMETSRRTVLEYLLKPINQSLAIAMTER